MRKMLHYTEEEFLARTLARQSRPSPTQNNDIGGAGCIRREVPGSGEKPDKGCVDAGASKEGGGVVSDLEETLAMQLQAAGLPEPVREYRFAPPRRWRADFAWPNVALLVEVEGGHWAGGRHTRGAGFDRDVEKYNEAGLLAWRLVRVTSTHIKSGQAIEWIKRALAV